MKNKLMSAKNKIGKARKLRRTPVGLLPIDWRWAKGELLFSTVKGKNPMGLTPAKKTGFMPYLSNEYFRENKALYAQANGKTVVAKEGDVLVLWDGSNAGEIFWAKPGIISSTMAALCIKDSSVEKAYLYFALKAKESLLKRTTKGTGIPHVDGQLLGMLPIALPPKSEQIKIGEVLCSIDKLLATSHKAAYQMRRIAKGVMGDLLTRGLPGQHKKYRGTGIGEIPQEWRCVRLKDLLREPIKNGYSPNSPQEVSGKWVLTLGAVTHNGFNSLSKKPAPQDDWRCAESLLKKGDLLVSRSNVRNRVGLAGVYEGIPENCSYPDLLMRVRVNESVVHVYWLEKWLLSGPGRAYMEREARGTSGSMVKIDRRILENLLVPLPSLGEQAEILKKVSSLNTAETLSLNYISELKKIKTVLMKELLTGKVRV